VIGVLYGGTPRERYDAYRREIAGFVEVLNQTPRDGALMGLIYDRRSKVMRIESALVGLPSFYVATRPHNQALVPVHYCGMRHMPCSVKKPMPWPGPWISQPFSWEEVDATFDYYLIRNPDPAPRWLGPVAANVDLVARVGEWATYRRRPRSAHQAAHDAGTVQPSGR
jgi:hypothetical protein